MKARLHWPQRLNAANGPEFGVWVKIPSLMTLDILARAEVDFVVLDLEHAPLDLSWCYQAVVVGQGMGMAVLARLPDASGRDVQRLLDCGVDGLVVPQVHGAGDAARALELMTFPPDGRRGIGANSPAGSWGMASQARYLAEAQSDVLRCVQFETHGAFADLDAILDLRQLNAAFLGPADLALASGLSSGDPRLEQLADRLLAATSRRGLPCGTAVGDALAGRAAAARGFAFVLVGHDAGLLGQAAADLVQSARRPA